MNVTECVYEVAIITMIMMVTFHRYGGHTVWCDMLAVMISFCSRSLLRLSHRLHKITSVKTVTSPSEWLGLLKCITTPDFSC